MRLKVNKEMITNFLQKWRGRVKETSSKELNLAIIFALIALLAKAVSTGYFIGYAEGRIPFDLQISPHIEPDKLEIVHVFITAALAISVFGLMSRIYIGFYISVFALLFAVCQYGWWYLDSLHLMENAGVKNFTTPAVLDVPHCWVFRDATPWDVTVLLVVIIILSWQVKVIFKKTPSFSTD